jgi:hypothetical protein
MRDAAVLGTRLLPGGYPGIRASRQPWGKFRGAAPAGAAPQRPVADG